MSTLGIKDSKLNNAIWVFTSNIVCLISTLIIGFLLPKYVNTDTFAHYRTYTLYVTYVGLFHFGMVNGIYLNFGSCSYRTIPKDKFKAYTNILILSQIIVGLLFIFTLISVMGVTNKSIPLLFVALNLIFININAYYSLINQFTLQFKRDSIIQLLSNFLNLSVFLTFIISKSNKVAFLLLGISLSNFIISIIWTTLNKEIFDAKVIISRENLIEVTNFIKTGFFVMISEFTGLIILSIDSVFVNLLFDTESFATYTFAISVITVLMQIISLGSKLIFPYLKRTEIDIIRQVYPILSILIIWFCGIIGGSLFVIEIFIEKLLPSYQSSIMIIYCLGILLIFRGPIELAYGNIYKATGLVKEYLKNNIIALAIGLISNIIAMVISGTLYSIAIASVLSYCAWFLITGLYFSKKMEFKFRNIFIFAIIITIAYVICCPLGIVGFCLYYLILGLLFLPIFNKLKAIKYRK